MTLTYEQLVAAVGESLTSGLSTLAPSSQWAAAALKSLNRLTPSEWNGLLDMVCEPIASQLDIRSEWE